MTKSCAAFGCTKRFVKGDGVSFHSFPFRKPELLKKWLAAMKRDKWKPSIHQYICSLHFKDDDFYRGTRKRELKPEAVPSIFAFPEHLLKKPSARKSPQKRKVEECCPNTDTLGKKGKQTSTEFCEQGDSSDHTYSIPSTLSPRKVQSTCKNLIAQKQKRLDALRSKLKVAQRKIKRQKARINNLQEILKDLKKNNLLADSAADLINSCFSGAAAEILNRNVSGNIGQFSDVIKSFALTLHFYSPKAYDYVRETFSLCLPHPSTLRTWYSHVDGSPGFTEPSFSMMRSLAESSKHKIVCSLMFDEMAIRKHIDWNGTQFVGYVDMGTCLDSDAIPAAREALVFYVVPFNGQWKLPIAYFLTDGIGAQEKCDILRECIIRVHNTSCHIACVTFYGLSSNFSMAVKLGANMTSPNLQPWFPNPASESDKVAVLLDPCHMLKLLRNAWATLGCLLDENDKELKWDYLLKLHNIQEKEGIYIANKLKRSHIEWRRQPMKVNLAAQTFSASVGKALKFLKDDLKLKEFSDCGATVHFIHVIDHLFDCLNSRNPFAKGFKSVLRSTNTNLWQPFLMMAEKYLLGLKDPKSRKPLYLTTRKTPIIGFLAAIKSISLLFTYVQQGHLKYLALYKCSQDHIETFFSVIQARGGWNNNPTAIQFKAAYKRLLVRQELKAGSNGNCKSTFATMIPSTAECDSYTSFLQRYGEKDTEVEINTNSSVFSLLKENVVMYVAGFVSSALLKSLHCDQCKAALTRTPSLDPDNDPTLMLMKQKNNGGLIIPSLDVMRICSLTEKRICNVLAMAGGVPPSLANFGLSLQIQVLSDLNGTNIFSCLHDHMFDSDILQNHIISLQKSVIAKYMQVRLCSLGKRYTSKISGPDVRRKLTKNIIFCNQ